MPKNPSIDGRRTNESCGTPLEPFVTCLIGDERVLFEKNSSSIKFAAGSTIIERDEHDSSVFFVLSGTVSVLNYALSGRAITHTSLQSGDIFGEMAAIDCGPRAAWVLAVTDCKILKIPGGIFMKLAESNHKFSLAISCARQTQEANERI